ncbi:MAG: class I SAM-dependent methyltransferase [Bryobacteraceae bacterium]|nr:class I SAM-dependent methyltransferase [Bryobacteraceae bacterium]
MKDLITDSRLAGLEMGSPEWFAAQRRMIQEKPLIRRCYDLWYSRLLRDADSVPASRKLTVVELGSGSSYIKRLRPAVITSDIAEGVADMVIDGRELPFPDHSVAALLLTHVFHHIPNVHAFFSESLRVLVPGGVISMVECTHTPFARLFFGRIHPEPFNDRATEWAFPSKGRMLDSNQALSWIVFERDLGRFRTLYPTLVLERWAYLPWFSYLLSGGVNLRSAVPPLLEGVVARLDNILLPLDPMFAIHWHLTIRKTGE